MVSDRKSNAGTILILVLWALGFLTIFAVHLGAGVRQRIYLLSRLDKRARLHLAAAAGIRKARAVFYTDLKINGSSNLPERKRVRFNNPEQFRNRKIGRGTYEVSYRDAGFPDGRYGFVDEERKINVNKVDSAVLRRLVEDVMAMDEDEADNLAKAIVDWREERQNGMGEFDSDEYYGNLEFPYREKGGDFETLDELLLIKGMNTVIYDKLLDFITIYGEGQVNVNTAAQPVLAALGVGEKLIDKILSVRRGKDGIEASEDDFIFEDVNNISADLSQFVELDVEEVVRLNRMGQQGKIGIQSSYFKIHSKGQLDNSDDSLTIVCVFDGNDGRIVYWRER